MSDPYFPTPDAIACLNGQRFHNKPLYGPNLPSVVLSGDRPSLRWALDLAVRGDFLLAVIQAEQTVWLHDFSECFATFKPNFTRWQLRDPRFPGLEIMLDVVPWAQGAGFAVRLEAAGTRAEDALLWAYGGARPPVEGNLMWTLDPNEHPELTQTGFEPAACQENQFELSESQFSLFHIQAEQLKVAGWFPQGSRLSLVNAHLWNELGWLDRNVSTGLLSAPLLCGRVKVPQTALYWSVGVPNTETPIREPRLDFEAGLARAQQQLRRVVCQTPDAFLDRAIDASNAAMDALYYTPTFVHGGMSWNVPLLGWRTRYGPTAYGYAHRVLQEAEHVLPFQVLESDLTDFIPEANRLLCLQSAQSRFYGAGHLPIYTHFYNMQEVYFDQLIHAWRWSGDPDLERLLLPALERHLQWQRECFDADDDGVYESYLNIWASDSVWYNGGGTAQASAYAYTGYRAAAELCERAGYPERAAEHRARAEHIGQGVRESLWIPERGHLAEYRDALGLKRRHDSACLYTLFLPIDAGMLSPLEALQTLHYSEWGLERVPVEGGALCWTSNWVPYEWSVRELDFADTLHLALAYYQSGRGRGGYDLLSGVVHESAFRSYSPGTMNIAPHLAGRGLEWFRQGRATDFADPVSLLGRTLVEGLFGLRPDYSQGVVTCAPQLPDDWDRARLEIPGFSLQASCSHGVSEYTLHLERPARVRWTLPVRGQEVMAVTLDGRPVPYELEPGYGETRLTIGAGESVTTATVRLHCTGEWVASSPLTLGGLPGEPVALDWAAGQLTALEDPQGCLASVETHLLGLQATLGERPGQHLLLARVEQGGLPRYQPIEVHILTPAPDPWPTPKTMQDWMPLDLSASFNADLRTVYQQQYLSPRTDTCSAQLGSDGFSLWTYPFWSITPPILDFGDVNPDAQGRLWTDVGVPFLWSGEETNACLTSRWDTFSTRVDLKVSARGQRLYALVAGTTNPMQTGLPNAALHLTYADGTEESLELIHPTNYLSLSGRYDWDIDAFALPCPAPPQVRLGEHLRAVVVSCPLRPDLELKQVSLECLSQEVVVGLLGLTVLT